MRSSTNICCSMTCRERAPTILRSDSISLDGSLLLFASLNRSSPHVLAVSIMATSNVMMNGAITVKKDDAINFGNHSGVSSGREELCGWKRFLFELKIHLTIDSCVSVRSSRYKARRKFGEHERCVLELLECSPKFPSTSYLDERTADSWINCFIRFSPRFKEKFRSFLNADHADCRPCRLSVIFVLIVPYFLIFLLDIN